MNDVYVYLVDLKGKAKGMVVPCSDGSYTIYIDQSLPEPKRLETYTHELGHIANGDYEKSSVGMIEFFAHKRG